MKSGIHTYRKLSKSLLVGAACYAAATLAMYPIPLFNILHAESMLVVSLVSYFVSSLGTLSRLGEGAGFRRVVIEQWLMLLVPLVLLTVTLLWIPNCGYLQGLLLFLLFPVITVVFGASAGYAAHAFRFRNKRLTLCVLGFGIVVLASAYDLLLHPQLYTYNHVFGGFLGPIYDEELAIRPGLFWFRFLTLSWAALFICIGMRQRAGTAGRRWSVRGGLIALVIGFLYALSPYLGFNTPAWYIEQRLGSVQETVNFAIYFDLDAVPEAEVLRMAENAEFRYAGLKEKLGVDVPGHIRLYLYPSPDDKAALTGSRETSVVPVWLRTPQIHMLQERFDRSFAHELVHVFSREFSLPLINTSISIGLLEGLAVALEPPSGRPSTHALVAASVAERADPDVFLDDVGDAVVRNLSAIGFWGGRGAVSYATMGSFVAFLLDEFGPNPLMQAFPTAGFEAAYGVPLDSLVVAWETFIRQYPVSEEAVALMTARFSIPSLFEVHCPHFVPRHVKQSRRAAQFAARGDTVRALRALERALALNPSYSPANSLWAEIHLSRSDAEKVVERFRRLLEIAGPVLAPRQHLELGDALILAGQPGEAANRFDTLRTLLSPRARDEHVVLLCRSELVDRPNVVQALYVPGDAPRRAAALAAHPDRHRCTNVLTAFRYADASDYEAAAGYLGQALSEEWPAAETMALKVRYGEYLLRAGQPEPAQTVFAGVFEYYVGANEPYRASFACDRLSQAAWMLSGRHICE